MADGPGHATHWRREVGQDGQGKGPKAAAESPRLEVILASLLETAVFFREAAGTEMPQGPFLPVPLGRAQRILRRISAGLPIVAFVSGSLWRRSPPVVAGQGTGAHAGAPGHRDAGGRAGVVSSSPRRAGGRSARGRPDDGQARGVTRGARCPSSWAPSGSSRLEPAWEQDRREDKPRPHGARPL